MAKIMLEKASLRLMPEQCRRSMSVSETERLYRKTDDSSNFAMEWTNIQCVRVRQRYVPILCCRERNEIKWMWRIFSREFDYKKVKERKRQVENQTEFYGLSEFLLTRSHGFTSLNVILSELKKISIKYNSI